ncbi:MAG TPA: hypothetical protein VGB63_12990 [Pedobacter sp.]|jgi:hypothetical protein
MIKLITIALLILGIGTAKAQYTLTHILKVDSGYLTPELTKHNIIKQVDEGVDTIRTTLLLGKIQTGTTKFQGGTTSWEFGYYVRSKHIYLDRNRRQLNPILFRVFYVGEPW